MRVEIDHKSGSRRGEREVFERESVLIGRGDANDVALDAFLDPTVSSQHAEIRFENDCYILYDMGSLNGTFLNGESVRRAALTNGDEIGLGQKGPRLQVALELDGAPPKPVDGERRQSSVSNKTSAERAIGDLDGAVVSRNPLLYALIGALVVAGAAAIWWWLGGAG